MTAVDPAPAAPAVAGVAPAPVVLLRQAHPVLPQQQQFLDRCGQVLLRSGASGQRAIVALHLVLSRHQPVVDVDESGAVFLTCAECRPQQRSAGEQFPCPTGQDAFNALQDLVL